MRPIRELGLLNNSPITVKGQQVVPRDVFIAAVHPKLHKPEGQDLVALLVKVSGIKDGKKSEVTFRLIDYYDAVHGISAMMRATAYSLSLTGQMQADGRVDAQGRAHARRSDSLCGLREWACCARCRHSGAVVAWRAVCRTVVTAPSPLDFEGDLGGRADLRPVRGAGPAGASRALGGHLSPRAVARVGRGPGRWSPVAPPRHHRGLVHGHLQHHSVPRACRRVGAGRGPARSSCATRTPRSWTATSPTASRSIPSC